MLYRLLLLLFLLSASSVSFAQQTQLFSQHLFNRSFVNPANTGLDEALLVTAFYRTQWMGLQGSPEYQTVTAESPLFDINSGAGITFYNDALGVERNTAIYGNYAYHNKLKRGILSAGIRVGWIQKSFDGSRLTTPGGQYTDNSVIQHNDGVIPNLNVSGGAPDVSLGLQYSTANYYFGIVADQLLGNTLTLNGENTAPAVELQRTFTATAGYNWVATEKITVTPNVLFRSDLVKNQLDLAMVATYNSIFRAGIGYRGYNNRSQDAVIAILGLDLSERWVFGYSYDYNISALADVNSGTHELFVQYRVPLMRPRAGKVINNPRFLPY